MDGIDKKSWDNEMFSQSETIRRLARIKEKYTICIFDEYIGDLLLEWGLDEKCWFTHNGKHVLHFKMFNFKYALRKHAALTSPAYSNTSYTP